MSPTTTESLTYCDVIYFVVVEDVDIVADCDVDRDSVVVGDTDIVAD
jgi:hypothetical protein